MGGGTKVLLVYAEMLAKRGHEVTVISVPDKKPSFYEQIRHIVKKRSFIRPDKNNKIFLTNSLVNHKIIDRSRSIVGADLPKCDVIIATWWETAEWLHAISSSLGKKVYFIQGHEVFDYLPIDRVKATYQYPYPKIVVSKWLADIMTQEYGSKNVVVVPNSFDRTQFYAKEREKNAVPTVGFLYSRSYIKGVSCTLRAIAILKQKIPNLKVVSFGSHDPRSLPDWDNSTDFWLLPEQSFIREIYSRCDLWITSSLSEGFNLTAIEAMACGTPVIATKTGWPIESIKNDVNGFLVGFNSATQIAEASLRVLSLPSTEWKQMSNHAVSTVQDSSWENSISVFESTLQKVLESS